MKLYLTETSFRIEFSWWEKILSLHGNFEIPLENVKAIKKGHPELCFWFLRIGTILPFLIIAGSYLPTRPWQRVLVSYS